MDFKGEYPNALVTKVKAHVARKAAQHSERQWELKMGNDVADLWAKKGAAKCPVDDSILQRVESVRKVSLYLWRYYGSLLLWAKAHKLFDHVSAGQRVSRTARLRALPVHSVALICGQMRCIRCLRLEQDVAHRQQGECLPPVALPHRLYVWNVDRPGVFCSACGAFSFGRTQKLARACTGRPPAAQAYRLGYARRGQHPKTMQFLGDPTPVGVSEWLIPLLSPCDNHRRTAGGA